MRRERDSAVNEPGQRNVQSSDSRSTHVTDYSGVARILHHERHGMHGHDIRQKSLKFLHKYNKLTLSLLKRL